MPAPSRRPLDRLPREAGASLLEVVVAITILLVLSLGLLPLGVVAISTTENQGHLVARATEYAQDKMEQLLALAYADSTTDTRVFPTAASGGTGLVSGGSSNANTPVAGYVDYLDVSGNLVTSGGSAAPSTWYYKRVWQITSPFANMKQVTVTTIVARGIGRSGRTPQATITALKTNPF
jgi:type II secretory pathway pseudopilin PulG